MKELKLEVKVKARARTRGIEEIAPGAYRVSTPAAPEDNRANLDVVDILAEHFRVPKSLVKLVRGQTTSRKLFSILLP